MMFKKGDRLVHACREDSEEVFLFECRIPQEKVRADWAGWVPCCDITAEKTGSLRIDFEHSLWFADGRHVLTEASRVYPYEAYHGRN